MRPSNVGSTPIRLRCAPGRVGPTRPIRFRAEPTFLRSARSTRPATRTTILLRAPLPLTRRRRPTRPRRRREFASGRRAGSRPKRRRSKLRFRSRRSPERHSAASSIRQPTSLRFPLRRKSEVQGRQGQEAQNLDPGDRFRRERRQARCCRVQSHSRGISAGPGQPGRAVPTALTRHDFAHRVVKALRVELPASQSSTRSAAGSQATFPAID